MPMAVTAILISGCAGSGYVKELNRYARKAKGPDIASSTPTPVTDAVENTGAIQNTGIDRVSLNPAMSASGFASDALTDVPGMAASPAKDATDRTGMPRAQLDPEPASPVASGIKGTHAATAEESFEGSDVRAKLRKTQNEPPEVDWANNSRKDWFFMIMAGAGLLVGLFGVNIGWVVFLVFGGLWLYRKIVRRK